MTSRSTRFTASLKQTVVYWGNPVAVGDGGYSFSAAVEKSVRWEQKSELFVDAFGKEVRSEAIVYVAEDLVVGGFLYLGDLDDLSSSQESDPYLVEGAYEIRYISKSPDRVGTSFLRKVYL